MYTGVLVLLLSVSTLAQIPASPASYCYHPDKHKHHLYGVITDYEDALETLNERTYEPINEKKPYPFMTVPGCEVKQVYVWMRHGTIKPIKEDLFSMQEKLPSLHHQILSNADLCPEDLEGLRRWNITRVNHLLVEDDNPLQGSVVRSEISELGRAFRARYEGLVKFINEAQLDVKFSNETQTVQTAEVFLNAFLRRPSDQLVASRWPTAEDMKLLEFSDMCERWQKEINNNPELSLIEWVKFHSSPVMKQLIAEVTLRLGLNRIGRILTYEDVFVMYDICRYEHVFNPMYPSPWCAVFLPEHLKVMEYDYDLRYYYWLGYGHPINYEQACIAVEDMVNSLQNAISSQRHKKIVLRFTAMLVPVLTRLGLFRQNEPPTATNYNTQRTRNWRNGVNAPFLGHLTFVTHKCNDHPNDFRVATYVQDLPLRLPGCPTPFCPIDMLLKFLGPIAQTCNFDERCSVVPPTPFPGIVFHKPTSFFQPTFMDDFQSGFSHSHHVQHGPHYSSMHALPPVLRFEKPPKKYSTGYTPYGFF